MEIEQFGMLFDERWLTPRIHRNYLPELFGDENITEYLHHCDAEHFVLNAICSTQRKIENRFAGQNDAKSLLIRDGLMRITNEVLFIRDPYQPNGFHPRISAFQSYAYRELSDENRHAFDRLFRYFFFERHNDFWKKTAISRLQPILDNTEMLVCGEDLGMLPATVQEVIQALQLFSLELERLSKVMGNEFTDVTTLMYHSVCTTSTHDMNPIRAWWNENRKKTQRYYHHALHHDGTAPEACSAVLAEQMIDNHLRAPSMLTLIPIQDWFAIDDDIKRFDVDAERINNPANPNQYWCYRMHITLEMLLESTHFNEKINAMITRRGR
jgi:4-alpha-glucanotransferase